MVSGRCKKETLLNKFIEIAKLYYKKETPAKIKEIAKHLIHYNLKRVDETRRTKKELMDLADEEIFERVMSERDQDYFERKYLLFKKKSKSASRKKRKSKSKSASRKKTKTASRKKSKSKSKSPSKSASRKKSKSKKVKRKSSGVKKRNYWTSFVKNLATKKRISYKQALKEAKGGYQINKERRERRGKVRSDISLGNPFGSSLSTTRMISSPLVQRVGSSLSTTRWPSSPSVQRIGSALVLPRVSPRGSSRVLTAVSPMAPKVSQRLSVASVSPFGSNVSLPLPKSQ
jgi:hypothetical protein